MKVVSEPENKLSGSLSSNDEPESPKKAVVECPAKGEITTNECLGHQSRPRIAAFSNPFFSKMWKACRSGCPNSLIEPNGDPIGTVATEERDTDKSGFQQRIEHLIATQFKGNRSAFVRATDLSAGGLKRYLSGGEPTLSKLLSIAKGAKINLLWLATGEGDKYQKPLEEVREKSGHYVANGVNEAVLTRAIEVVDEVLALAGKSLAIERKAGIVSAVYSALNQPGASVGPVEIMRLIRSKLE